ncbi:hypothetical protein AVEN_166939-1 [Araneus ventricosus]|uniref:Uncharacterized protein n=1 Tax=Araneus ventricosus TaxID=182803 RepID=A0A4Y2LPU0_ARAVE|nr:hypothetical protein AVEN_166939-1 [Araneus ventricosus]
MGKPNEKWRGSKVGYATSLDIQPLHLDCRTINAEYQDQGGGEGDSLALEESSQARARALKAEGVLGAAGLLPAVLHCMECP